MADQRWGLTLPLPMLPLAAHREHVERAEAAGYTDVWSGETNGPDGFTPLALAASWTERVRLGTGVVGVFTRGPALLAQQAAALADGSGGRFALGIGASSDRIVAGWNGIPFERPLARVSETVDFLDAALAGERTATGFKLEQAPRSRRRSSSPRCGARCCDSRSRRRRRVHQLPAALRPREGGRRARGRARGLRAPLPFLLPPRRARAGRAAGAVHVRLLHQRPGLRGLLPLARPRRRDRRDVRGVGGEGPRARDRRRAVGADRGDVHLRRAGAMRERLDAVRRRRHHAARS